MPMDVGLIGRAVRLVKTILVSPQQIRNDCRNSGGLLPDAAPGDRAKSGQLLRGYCGVTGASVKTAPPGKTRLPCRLSCCVSSCGEEMEVWTEAEVQMPSTRQQPDNRKSTANGTNSLTIMTRSHFSEGDAFLFFSQTVRKSIAYSTFRSPCLFFL